MAGLLGIGLTGLFAAQRNLETTSHNIHNVDTPNFSRQRVIQETQNPYREGNSYVGQGTLIQTIQRQFSQHLENRVLSADTRFNEYSAYNAQIQQINNLLADQSSGLSPALQHFFAGVQEVVANPTSISSRQSLISSGQSFVERFHAIDTRLSEIRQSVEGQLNDSVEAVNRLTRQIADMNHKILISDTTNGVVANDLHDRRDHLVRELNSHVKATAVKNEDGQLDIFIGSGQSIVQKDTASQIKLVPAPDDPTRNNFALVGYKGLEIRLPERLLSGGKIGGLLDFRRDALDNARDGINRIAVQFTSQFNTQHRKGVTLDGAMGQDFFTLQNVRSDGGANPPPAFTITNDNLLTNDRYRVVYDNTLPDGYSLTRLSDSEVVTPASVGFAMDVSTPPPPNGAAYIVAPLRSAARDLAIAIREPRDVAAASPVSIKSALNNLGTGKVDGIRVLSDHAFNSAWPHFDAFEFTYNAAANELQIGANPAGFTFSPAPAAYNPSTESTGKTFQVLDAGGQPVFEFTFSGTPRDGAHFTFQPTEAGVADNRNAVELGKMQTQKSMLLDGNGNPTANFQSAYARIVSHAGNKGREAEVGMKAQKVQYEQAMKARNSLSGVNLDEEAANLLRYQLAYQASSRVMSTAQRLFDEIAAIGR